MIFKRDIFSLFTKAFRIDVFLIINNLIEKQLHKDKREQSVKILLLGTGHFMVLVWGLMVLMQSNSDPVLCCTVHEIEAKESISRRKWKVYNLEADENLAPKSRP